MINFIDFAQQAEKDLRSAGTVQNATCQAWTDLHPETRAAFASALTFLGCCVEEPQGVSVAAPSEAERVAAARLMLLELGADSDDPRWSSAVLERLLQAVVAPPGGSVGDLLLALNGVLADFPGELSRPLANFIKDLVVACFTRYRASYEAVDWARFAHTVTPGATKPQLYLALHAIPRRFILPELGDSIASGLHSSPFQEEAVAALAS